MSAHSHYAISKLNWGKGIEINVGSTTDWPMEANVTWFPNSQPHASVRTFNIEPGEISYIGFKPNEASEICRHLPAAEKLASLNVKDFTSPLISPRGNGQCIVTDQASWNLYSNKLKKAVSTIRDRFKNEADYRELLLNIASAASKAEYDSFDLVELIP